MIATHVIVYNRKAADDPGVSVCRPVPEIMRFMVHGGMWNDRPRGFVRTQVERMVARGIAERAARRYANAVTYGGKTQAEAFEIIAERDCAPLGTAIEVMPIGDLPADRWFRDAWVRSANGGPISIDLVKAREIQRSRIAGALSMANLSLAQRMRRLIRLETMTIERAIARAGDEHELRRVWPRELREVNAA